MRWFVVAAVCTYIIGYRFYARLIEAKVVRLATTTRPRPKYWRTAPITCRRTGGCCSAITSRRSPGGATGRPGPGHPDGLPAGDHLIIIGAVFAAVQDYLRWRSRPDGAAVRWDRWPEMNWALSAGGRHRRGTVIMVILLAVLGLVVVNALAESPWACSPSR